MPTLPTLTSHAQLQSPRYPQATLADFGGAAFEATDRLNNLYRGIQNAADAAEIAAKTAEATVGMPGIIQKNANEISSSIDYQAKSAKDIEDYHKQIVDSGTSSENRKLIELKLRDNLLKSKFAIDHHTYLKKVDEANANADYAFKTYSDLAVGADNSEAGIELQKEYARQYSQVIGNMRGNGLIKAKEAQDKLQAYDNKVNLERMTVQALSDPPGFITSVDNGDFKNKGIDPVAIERTLKIAESADHLRSVRAAQEMKRDSDTVERELERLAENKQLDPWLVDKAARVFGWDKNKKDGLLNIQLGVKVASPFENELIKNAMDPVHREVRPSMVSINKAWDNLRQAEKERQVSPNSPEMIAARGHLQTLARSWDIKSDIKTRESTFDARRDVQDLYGKYFSGKRDSDVQSEIKDHLLKLSKMNPEQQKSYVNDLGRKLEKEASTLAPSGSIQADKLRGALREKHR